MKARENPVEWKKMLKCIDAGDFKNANKIASLFFGGIYHFGNKTSVKNKRKPDIFKKSNIDKLNEFLNTNADNEEQLIYFLRDHFNKKTGFFIINRKYLVQNPLDLVSYFFEEEEINERLMFSKKEKKLINYTQWKLGNMHLFCEQRSEISYDLKNISVISKDELDRLIKEHTKKTYIVYDDMFFTDPYEFWVVFGFFEHCEPKKRRNDHEYFKEIFNFCEKGSISFIERNKVKQSELKKSAYKKIETLEKYNKHYVDFKLLNEKNVYKRDIVRRTGISEHVGYYFSSALDFKNNKKNSFLSREHFRYYRK